MMTDEVICEKEKLESINYKRFLCVAIFIHLIIVSMVFGFGYFELMPGMIKTSGIGNFADDGVQYLQEIEKVINGSQVVKTELDIHTRAYLFSFVFLSPLFGFNIFSAELVNLGCYVAILFLVYALGREIFDTFASLLAATVVGLWPSFLLHTTQLLKTPLIITAVLTFVWVNVRWYTREHNHGRAFLHAMLGFLTMGMLWLLRSEWWPLLVVILILGPLGLVLQVAVERKWKNWNLAAAVLLVVLSISIPKMVSLASEASSTSESPPTSESSSDSFQEDTVNQPVGLWDATVEKANAAAARVGDLRDGFISSYPTAGSNIDTGYHIQELGDLVRYLPRATVVGLFAPFPGMWIERGGQLGLSARALSGLESILIYIIQLMAVAGIWHKRRHMAVWYLLGVVFIAVTALGLVVTNVGALYRFRYSFWMILIVLGAGGFREVVWPWLRSNSPHPIP